MQVELQRLDLRYGALLARDRRLDARALAAASQATDGLSVVVVAEGTRLVVVEGFERVRALERLGHDTTAATLWSVTAPEALDRKSTRLNSSHIQKSRMPSSA